MRFKSVLRSISVAVLFGAAIFSSIPTVAAASSQEQASTSDIEKAVTSELKLLRSLMNQLNVDADQLQTLSPSGLWQTHAFQLNQVRDDINRVGDQLDWLQRVRFSAAPWQQEAIDSVLAASVEVASRTSAAIGHLNEHHQYLWSPDYVDHLRTISTLSDYMHGLVDNHLKIVEAREKIENIQEELADRAS